MAALLVTIVTPVYNAAKYLPQAIKCVQDQVGGIGYQHIFINDCSTDHSLDILKGAAAKDKRISVISLEKKSGPVVARNIGISAANGKYLAFLDADDYWLPQKLLMQVRFMERSNTVLSFTDYRFVSEDGSLIGPRLRGPNRIGWRRHHMTRSGLGCLTVMINREICAGFQFVSIDPLVDLSEDFIAWSNVIMKYGPALRVPHDLGRYRVIIGSRSSNVRLKARSIWHVYRFVERIRFSVACLYFLSFATAAIAKRFFYRPRWPLETVDGSSLVCGARVDEKK